MSTTSICGHKNVTETSGEMICMQCGAVLEQNIIADTDQVEFHHQMPIGQVVHQESAYNLSVTRKNLPTLLDAVLARIGLDCGVSKTIFAMHRQAVTAVPLWSHGARSRYLLAACVFVLARDHAVAVKLVDIAEWMDCPYHAIGWYVSKLYAVLSLPLPPTGDQRICRYIDLFVARYTSDICLRSSCARLAKRIVPCLVRSNIVAGRFPTLLASACVTLALRSEYATRKICMNGKKSIEADIALIASVSIDQMKLRITEVISSILDNCNFLPWLDSVNRRNFHHHLADILDAISIDSEAAESKEIETPARLFSEIQEFTSVAQLENRRLILHGVSEDTIKYETRPENLLTDIEYAAFIDELEVNEYDFINRM